MSDSLRDQLIAAGFDAPKKTEKKSGNANRKSSKGNNAKNTKPKRKGTARAKPASNNNNKKTESDAAALERKKLKAQIKELIDNNKLDNWKGEVTFRYTVEKKIRELYVNDEAHKQLTSAEVAITRLNGDTYLVPQTIATDIKKVNSQWSVFNTGNDKDQNSDPNTSADDDYADFQVPDDLKW